MKKKKEENNEAKEKVLLKLVEQLSDFRRIAVKDKLKGKKGRGTIYTTMLDMYGAKIMVKRSVYKEDHIWIYVDEGHDKESIKDNHSSICLSRVKAKKIYKALKRFFNDKE